LYDKSDQETLFFSTVIDDVIVMNGLNRLIPSFAQMGLYDSKELISLSNPKVNDTHAYFRLSFYDYVEYTIWDQAERYNRDINELFCKQIYDLFFEEKKIKTGRFDVVSFIYGKSP
jgi:hypothetical protein